MRAPRETAEPLLLRALVASRALPGVFLFALLAPSVLVSEKVLQLFPELRPPIFG